MKSGGIYISRASHQRNNIEKLLVEAAHELALGNDVDAWIAAALALHKMAELDADCKILDKVVEVLRGYQKETA